MDPPQSQRRKVLSQTVALMVQEVGYESGEKVALEMLTEMFQSGKNFDILNVYYNFIIIFYFYSSY